MLLKSLNDWYRGLKQIFPPYLVLLALFPIIIGFFIDYDLSDSRYVVINLVWMPIFTIPSILTQRKILVKVSAVLYFLVGIIEIGHWIVLKGPVTITSLLVISNTNYNEAIEFMDLKGTFGLIVLIPYLVLFVFSLRHPYKFEKSKYRSILIWIVALVSSVFILENAINGRLVRKGTPQIVKVAISFVNEINLYKEAMKRTEPRELDAKLTHNAGSQTCVLIIGESCSRRHLSLYGASRITNPKLGSRNDIIIYDNVVSPYSNTLNAVLSCLSESNLENKIPADRSVDIIDIFHSAGFKTYWISNQSPIGVWDNVVTLFANKSDYVKFVNTSSNTSFEATLNVSYDSKLFSPFIKVLNEKVAKKFIVLHLMGSHSAYSKRYPSSFNRFRGASKKDRTIAEYDNSVLYNDFIVDSLLRILSSTISANNNSVSSAIYLSDHGENVYDEGGVAGHDYANELPAPNVEVPFIVWLSPNYIKLDKTKAETVSTNIKKPFVSDDLFHAIMDLNHITSPYLNKSRSIFNAHFNDLRKRVLEDGRDYDKK